MSGPNVLDVSVEEVQIVHNLASLVNVQDNTLDHYYTLELAVVKHGDLHSTGVLGNKVSVLEPHTIACPFVLERNEGTDLVVFAIKHRGELHYYYGVPVDVVAAFKPPPSTAPMQEEGSFITVKTSSPSAKTAKVLENTESMPKLKDNTELILKHLAMFKSLGLTSLKKISHWVLQTSFTTVVRKVLTEAEGRERKLAAEKALRAGDSDREINRSLAADAAKVWADIDKKLMAHAPFYSDGFPQRIFIMEDANALDKCLEDLAKHKLRGWLIPALKAHAAALAAGGVRPVAPATPLKRLLEPPPPEPEPLDAAAAAVAPGGADGDGAEGEGDVAAGADPKATDATDATDATAGSNANAEGGNANTEGVDPTSKDTTNVPAEQGKDAKQPRQSSRRPPAAAAAAAESAPPPAANKRQQQPKTHKRDRNDADGGVPVAKVGRQKHFPDIGDNPNSNPDPDPKPNPNDPNPNPNPNPLPGEGATVPQSDRMLAKIKELTAANEKFQGTISELKEQLTVAKAGKGAEVDKLKAKLQAQEVQIATLKTTVEFSGKIHNAFMTGLAMQRPGAAFASPASSASTATPPPLAGGIGGLFQPEGTD